MMALLCSETETEMIACKVRIDGLMFSSSRLWQPLKERTWSTNVYRVALAMDVRGENQALSRADRIECTICTYYLFFSENDGSYPNGGFQKHIVTYSGLVARKSPATVPKAHVGPLLKVETLISEVFEYYKLSRESTGRSPDV